MGLEVYISPPGGDRDQHRQRAAGGEANLNWDPAGITGPDAVDVKSGTMPDTRRVKRCEAYDSAVCFFVRSFEMQHIAIKTSIERDQDVVVDEDKDMHGVRGWLARSKKVTKRSSI